MKIPHAPARHIERQHCTHEYATLTTHKPTLFSGIFDIIFGYMSKLKALTMARRRAEFFSRIPFDPNVPKDVLTKVTKADSRYNASVDKADRMSFQI